jgi:hypothetical protein
MERVEPPASPVAELPCSHHEAHFEIEGGRWAYECSCGQRGESTNEDNTPGCALEDFRRRTRRPDFPRSSRAG